MGRLSAEMDNNEIINILIQVSDRFSHLNDSTNSINLQYKTFLFYVINYIKRK